MSRLVQLHNTLLRSCPLLPIPETEGYPLFPGDVLRQMEDGTWMKIAPGLAIGGFRLMDQEVQSLTTPFTGQIVLGGGF